MQSIRQHFHDLHHSDSVLVLPTIWDAASAGIAQRVGAKAVATSSAAMAWSCGYADGGALPEHALLQRIGEVVRAVPIPVSVDLEDGYSRDPEAVATLVLKLVQLGVAGINLEDGADPPALLEAKLLAIRRALDGRPLFINARTDVYLAAIATGEEAVRMTIDRICRYRQAGADGGFVPALRDESEIAAVARAIGMPLNLMTVPGLPALDVLHRAGVRRLSAGPALFLAAFHHLQEISCRFLAEGSVDCAMLGYAEMNSLQQSNSPSCTLL